MTEEKAAQRIEDMRECLKSSEMHPDVYSMLHDILLFLDEYTTPTRHYAARARLSKP